MYKMLDGCNDAKNQIIHANPGGFKQKEGTFETLHTIQNIFQCNKHIYCAFLDQQKAYDSV